MFKIRKLERTIDGVALIIGRILY